MKNANFVRRQIDDAERLAVAHLGRKIADEVVRNLDLHEVLEAANLRGEALELIERGTELNQMVQETELRWELCKNKYLKKMSKSNEIKKPRKERNPTWENKRSQKIKGRGKKDAEPRRSGADRTK